MDKLILHSYAKLNLCLLVLNKRPDSYHNIDTVFERLSLSDKIIFKSRREREINIISDSRDLPEDSSKNLVYRSAKLLQDTFDVAKGADIKIIKRIPVGAGLGGGSSNAAAALAGLNKLWGLNLSRRQLVSLAKKLGADVPFFIYDTSFAQGTLRGDRIRPLGLPGNVKLWHILVVPKIKVLTPDIYKAWDRLSKGRRNNYATGLTIPKHNVKIIASALMKKDYSLLSSALFNSLEEVTVKLYSEIRYIKQALGALGLKLILMSGSGPAVFAIAPSRKEAVSISKQLKKRKAWQVFVVRTR